MSEEFISADRGFGAIQTFLRAAKHLLDKPDIRFLIVGDGKERPRLEKLARKWNLINVTFTGSRSKLKIPEILASSDVCVATLQDIPMFRTTYPNKVFDYMAAGRPVILAIDGVIREVIESANGGIFVHPGNDESLASVWLDIKIILMTMLKVFKREGISQLGQATTDIGAFTYINAKYGVTIEDFVQIGSHCSIYSVSTIDNKQGRVRLKKNCKIGSHSVIMPGVTVGENAIVGACCFVTCDVPDNVIAAGVPATVIKEIRD